MPHIQSLNVIGISVPDKKIFSSGGGGGGEGARGVYYRWA